MGLPLAVDAHRRGNIDEAESHYRRALEQGCTKAVLFQNLGAILREKGLNEDAAAIYGQGLAHNPGDPGILTNRANLLRETSPQLALADAFLALQKRLIQNVEPRKEIDLWLTIIHLLRNLDSAHWALAVLRLAISRFGSDVHLVSNILLMLDSPSFSTFSLTPEDKNLLTKLINKSIDEADILVASEIRFALAFHLAQKGRASEALSAYQKAISSLSHSPPSDSTEEQRRQQLIDVNSWNMGCTLLKLQDLKQGWLLYEYGLRAPAKGKQRWQRSLEKPFNSNDIPLWRGQSLRGQRLLLLGEQAIGDTMMFLTIVPTLASEARSLGILLGSRLLPIYQRSFPANIKLWNSSDVSSGRLKPFSYDYQIPLGSVFQHRFHDVEDYAPKVPILKVNSSRASSLRKQYLEYGSVVERLIGISWQGGGRPDRIKLKSIPNADFTNLLRSCPGVRFVSLQYGNASPTVAEWRSLGLDVIYDHRINPLKNMELWLDQVSACDAVVSVANTTIHGAGGLGIPTMCLLSLSSDWRWFDSPDVTTSYWYPTVGIARQDKDGTWSSATEEVSHWIKSGTPLPDGPCHS